jgi:hypothetical protein
LQRSPDAKRETRAEFISDIATDQLEQRIRIGKRRKRQAKLGIAQAEVRFDERGGRRDVDPIHIEDQVHQADDK